MDIVMNTDVSAVSEHNDTVRSYFMIGMEELRDQTLGSYLQLVNEFVVEPLVAIQPHYHNSHEFYYVLSGQATVRVGNRVEQVNPGSLIHTPPNIAHSIFAHRSGVRCLAFAVSFQLPGEMHTPVTFEDWPPVLEDPHLAPLE